MYHSSSVVLEANNKPLKGTVKLPTSKSISNRLLIINALSHDRVVIKNLSNAQDTRTLKKLLAGENQVYDVGDAGTAMRFLTSYLAIQEGTHIIQGTERMHQRPIGALVEALQEVGADITYLDKKGYPPLRFNGFSQVTTHVKVPGNISSQFITSLLMIAPYLSQGLSVEVEGVFMSKPYVDMTVRLMQKCGIEVALANNTYSVKNHPYQPTIFTVEADWSAASYWFSFVATQPGSDIILEGLQENSLQGDHHIREIGKGWGVDSEFTPLGLRLKHTGKTVDEQFIDFSDTPDLAQTVAVAHSLLGIKGKYIGLESLRIKETDRIAALQKELSKFNARLEEEGEFFILIPSEKFPDNIVIETYQDHRMAMAFAPLCNKMQVEIINRDVVNKSYPDYWSNLSQVDISLT